MKRVIAIMRPEVKDKVVAMLEQSPDISHFSLKSIQHYGDVPHTRQHYRGRSVTQRWQSAYELSILVADAQLDTLLNTLLEHARLGQKGDGVLMVQALEQVIALETGNLC